MVFKCFSDCSVECSGCLEGWLVVFKCFSDCLLECSGMLGRLVSGV